MYYHDDLIKMTDIYRAQYQQYGLSPKSLGWNKGEQQLRFEVLTSQYDFSGKSVLDIGCGFGDLNKALSKYQNYFYHGVDLVEEFINEAKSIYSSDNIAFECVDFSRSDFVGSFDYAIASGTFNMKLESADNYEFVESAMSKTYQLTKDGFAFDFLSDRVDYRLEHTFHYAPAKVLDMAYSYSRNVILRNDYKPFEFSVFVFTDDSFEKYDTVFNRYKKLHHYIYNDYSQGE